MSSPPSSRDKSRIEEKAGQTPSGLSINGSSYFRSWFHLFDATIIIVGFVVDVLLHGVLEEVASLVIVLRLWRVFKIIEELSVGAEEQMEQLQKRLESLEDEKRSLEDKKESLERRIRDLERG